MVIAHQNIKIGPGYSPKTIRGWVKTPHTLFHWLRSKFRRDSVRLLKKCEKGSHFKLSNVLGFFLFVSISWACALATSQVPQSLALVSSHLRNLTTFLLVRFANQKSCGEPDYFCAHLPRHRCGAGKTKGQYLKTHCYQ